MLAVTLVLNRYNGFRIPELRKLFNYPVNNYQAWPYRYLQATDAGTAPHLTMNRAGRITLTRDTSSDAATPKRKRPLKFGAVLIAGAILLLGGSQVFLTTTREKGTSEKPAVAEPVRECRETDILGTKLEPSTRPVGSTALEFGGIRVMSVPSICNSDRLLRVEVHEIQKDTWVVKKIIPSG